MDKNEVEKVGKFQEHKNLIDPSRLTVVAFLQDDATKHILTAIYAVVDHNPEHERNEGGISVVGVDEDFAGNLDAPRCSLHALEANAQVVLNLPADHAGIVLLQEKQLREEMEFRKAPVPKDPAIQLDALPEFIRLHPAFISTKGGVYNAASEFSSYIKKDHPDATALSQKLLPIHAALKAAIPQFYTGMFDSELPRIFLKENIDPSTAKELAQSGVDLYDHGDCLQDDRFSAESHHIHNETPRSIPCHSPTIPKRGLSLR